MRFWITTDLHLGHKKIIEYGRPEDFEEKIFKSHSRLTEKDVLICLGDVSLGQNEEMHAKYIQPLACKKWLVKGNHDSKSNNWYLRHGWDFVCRNFKDIYYGKKILFSHIPQVDDGWYDLNIHGHLHDDDHRIDEIQTNEKQMLLALEHTNYQPVSLEHFINLYN